MSRKPGETVQINLRLKEALRRRLEREAKKRGVSLNFEMTSRIEQSFEMESLRTQEVVTADMHVAWSRFGQLLHGLASQGDLRRAAEMLIAEVEAMPECLEREGVQKAVATVKQVTNLLDREAALAIRRMGHV